MAEQRLVTEQACQCWRIQREPSLVGLWPIVAVVSRARSGLERWIDKTDLENDRETTRFAQDNVAFKLVGW